MIVIVDKVGQLGNRLFHFAHFIAFAETYGVRVANPGFDDFARYFPVFRDDVLCRFPTVCSPIPVTERTSRLAFSVFERVARSRRRLVPVVSLGPGETCGLRSASFRRQAERPLLLVSGWQFRDSESFSEHAELLRRLFTPSGRHRAAADRAVLAARRGAVLVGVHIRHQDYATYAGGRHFHALDAYARMMDRLGELFDGRDVRFLVCSDDPANPAALAGGQVTPGPGHLVEDLYALAQCDYIVGPPSTYSAWASFYGKVPLLHFEDPDGELSLNSFRVNQG